MAVSRNFSIIEPPQSVDLSNDDIKGTRGGEGNTTVTPRTLVDGSSRDSTDIPDPFSHIDPSTLNHNFENTDKSNDVVPPTDTTSSPVPDPTGDSSDSSIGLEIDLSSLHDSLSSIYDSLFQGNFQKTGQNISSILGNFQKFLQNNVNGLTKDEATQLATQLYNTINGFLSGIYNQMYQRENWLLECSYNSPKNQIQRLMDSGINPSFYYGCLGNSNAGQIGSSDLGGSSIQYTPQSSFSDFGQKLMAGVDGFVQLSGMALQAAQLPSAIKVNRSSAAVNFEQAKTINQLRPFQLSQMMMSNMVSYADYQGKMLDNSLNAQLKPYRVAAGAMQPEQVSANIENTRANTEASLANAYKAYNDVDVAFESLAQGWQQLVQTGIMNAQTIKLGYDTLNLNEFDKIVSDLMDEVEHEKYFEVNTETGEQTEVSASVGLDLAEIFSTDIKASASNILQRGDKTYKREKVKSRSLNPDKLGEFWGQWMKYREAVSSGSFKVSPQKNASTISKVAHVIGHATDMADKKQIQDFTKYTVGGVFKPYNPME